MDMSWQALLKDAAACSFEKNMETLSAVNDSACFGEDLHKAKIRELSEKILLLPHQGIVLLFSRYCFALSPEKAEKFFELKNAAGSFLFYRSLLSSSLGFDGSQTVSDKSFEKACKIALKNYLRAERAKYQNVDVPRRKRIQIFQSLGRAAAIFAITLSVIFSTCMFASAQFREKLTAWVIKTFERYSIFEMNCKENDKQQNLMAYKISYLPDGASLKETLFFSGYLGYEYAVGDSDSITVAISYINASIGINTENAKIESFDADGLSGFLIAKDGLNYVCFERDSCFFTVYGSIDVEELIKVAAGISKE